jgi:hypothetical protein
MLMDGRQNYGKIEVFRDPRTVHSRHASISSMTSHGIRLAIALVALSIMALLAIPTLASAEEGAAVPSEEIPLRMLERAAEGGELIGQATDPKAAEELPHRDLGRQEALELTESVFGPQLLATEGIFGGLEVKKYLSEQSAIVTTEDEPEALSEVGGGGEDSSTADNGDETVLLESTIPLRTEGPLGAPVPVDLTLEKAAEGLTPVAPLVEVEIPHELGEGIKLPESRIGVELVGAPTERTPSVLSENVASYPNVARETDFSVATTPTGIETLTTIRSADAPDSETLRLDLPSGDTLAQDEAGAVVEREGREILSVLPPMAIDADGTAVPVVLTVEGDTLTLTASPGPETVFPIMLDPILESYDWFDFAAATGQGTWHFQGNAPGFSHSYAGTNPYGIWILAPSGSYYTGNQAGWYYYVPRLKEEEAQGRTPTSYIVRMNLMHVGFHTSAGPYSPYETMGILGAGHWAGLPGHEAVWGYGGNYPAFYAIPNYPGYPGWGINFENGEPGKRDQTAKVGLGLGLAAVENANLNPQEGRIAELGGAAVEVADEDLPHVANGSISPWMNQTATAPITAEATDSGLGVRAVSFELPGGQGSRTYVNSCLGGAESPCPYNWKAAVAPGEYSPASMPQGIDEVKLGAQDVLWNTAKTGEKALLRIDHTAPSLLLSGTLTEQPKLGTTLPQYVLKYSATDGTEAIRQSGVVSTEVRLDGKAVEAKYAPGCAGSNCAISKEWVLNASSYAVGEHTLEVIAIDGVGLESRKTVKFSIAKDTTGPALNASGSFFEGPGGWLMQKSYSVGATATDVGGYGVKTIALMIDGKSVKSATQSCPAGACSASISPTVNTLNYQGGAHTVELVATDAAGNTSKRNWTINIDPTGAIPNGEASSTIEAGENTNEEVPPLGSEEEGMAEGSPVGVEAGSETGEFVSTGAAASSTIETGSSSKLEIETPQGSVAINPMTTGESGEVATGGQGTISADTASSTDTVYAPKYNGLLQFQDIRTAEAPEQFSWEIELRNGETLKELPGGLQAAVYFEGTIEMMLIEAMPAHDAVGHTVPTNLAVTNKNRVTLTVKHRQGSYVYPVTAGPSFEVGWSKVEVIKPPEPLPTIETEFEGYEVMSAPVPASAVPPGSATASSVWVKEEFYKKVLCSHNAHFSNSGLTLSGSVSGAEENCGDPWHGTPGVYVAFREGLHGRFFQKDPHNVNSAEVWHVGTPTESIGCVAEAAPYGYGESQRKASIENCVWWGKTAGGGGSSATWGSHITPVGFTKGEYRGWCGDECGGTQNPWRSFELPPMTFYLWADGHYKFHSTRCIDCG